MRRGPWARANDVGNNAGMAHGAVGIVSRQKGKKTLWVLTFSVVQSTRCAPPIVCSCRYVGGFFVAPNLSFYIRFLNLYHHQYHSFAPPSLHPRLVFEQVMGPGAP